jgi:hypothetical protein
MHHGELTILTCLPWRVSIVRKGASSGEAVYQVQTATVERLV